MLIAEQIARANAEAEASDDSSISATQIGLQRQDGAAPLKLAFAPKKISPPPSSEPTSAAEPSLNDSSPGAGSSSTPDALAPASPNYEVTLASTPPPSSASPSVQAPLKMNVFKSKSAASVATAKPTAPPKMNIFKTVAKQQSSSAPVSSVTSGGTAVNSAKRGRDDPPLSAAQRLIMEDQERKKRRMYAGVA